MAELDPFDKLRAAAAQKEQLRKAAPAPAKPAAPAGAESTAPAGGARPAPPAGSDDEDEAQPIGVPPEPRTTAETGLSDSFIADLALKHIYFAGTLEGIEIANRMCLDFQIVNESLEALKKQELAMSQGGSGAFGGVRIKWTVTEKGTNKVDEIMKRDNYRGPAPVPYKQYIEQLAKQSIRSHKITPEKVKTVFSRLILDPQVPDRMGPAINSGKSIFLYGPPGNGKTSLAECINDTIGGRAFVPHAIIVESEIVRIFDDLYHKKMETKERYDRRFVYSKRPVVVVGGELTMAMLDLTWEGQATYYEAPFQMKANSGVLFIDDFGRQRCEPQELLNRWIVPLESQFDFIAFRTGGKAKIPFDVLIVFSTNLDPKDLVDEAFLRRIRYKIEVGNPTEENFKKIFQIMAKKNNIPYDEKMVDYLIEKHYKPKNRNLRACQPRDLLEQMVDINKFTGAMPGLTPEVIDKLCELYFVEL